MKRPPRKRKTSLASLRRIVKRLGLPRVTVKRNYITDCVLQARDGETLFSDADSGDGIRVTIDRYAIIPIEKYHALMGELGVLPSDHWPCGKCGAEGPTPDGHDPCIANLPGVQHACCGHGIELGYVMFDDGRVIRGRFDAIERAAGI